MLDQHNLRSPAKAGHIRIDFKTDEIGERLSWCDRTGKIKTPQRTPGLLFHCAPGTKEYSLFILKEGSHSHTSSHAHGRDSKAAFVTLQLWKQCRNLTRACCAEGMPNCDGSAHG